LGALWLRLGALRLSLRGLLRLGALWLRLRRLGALRLRLLLRLRCLLFSLFLFALLCESRNGGGEKE
jgi:hypothetical protein